MTIFRFFQTASCNSIRQVVAPVPFAVRLWTFCWVVLLGWCKINQNASLMGWVILGFCTFYNTWVCIFIYYIYIYICACISLHFHLTRLCECDVHIYISLYMYIYIHSISVYRSIYIAGLTIVSCLETRKSSKIYQIYHGNINRIKLIWEKHQPHPKRW